MSLIYKALQQVESEREGKASSDPADATELLKRAEDKAREQRNAESHAARSTLSRSPEEGMIGSGAGLLADDASEQPAYVDVSRPRQIALDALETLHILPPLHPQLVALADKESPAAEAFRLLGVRLRHLRRERRLKRLLISSTVTQEGKSLVSANLGCTIAAGSRQNVLLIEGDIRRPSLTELFGIVPRSGLCEYLSAERTLTESIYRIEEANIWLMPTASGRDHQIDSIDSELLPNMLQQLSESFHWIIIDSPPILPLADTSIWARLADGILLVTRNSTTEKKKLQRGLEALDEDKLVGAVLNSATTSSEHDYYYYRSSSAPLGDSIQN
jgi:capsular exopolysaccharide synthesis family protein